MSERSPAAAHRRWRARRHAELAAPDSWLGLIGLHWLAPGANLVGSAADATVQLPGGPARQGELLWADGRVAWQPECGPARVLETDHAGQPTAVDLENWSFFIVDRDGRLAARVRDRAWAATRQFAGVPCFDYDPAWRIDARWETLPEALNMEVPNVSGELKMVTVTQRAVFELGGETVTLLPMSVGDDGVFFVFRDRSSGRETYGAGRFLKVPVAVDGKITLDFNFAYNPPCAFTAFATCLLPPPENWLPFAIAAGEKKWSDEAGH
jgi:hypothetical protein